MILGPDIYYKCPKCGAYLYTHSLTSGNTFGAKTYSDGRMDAPMLPKFPNLTKCRKCEAIVMLNRLEPQYKKRHLCKKYKCMHMDIIDLYKALDAFPNDELYIRLKIWRAYNDFFRPFSVPTSVNTCHLLDSQKYIDNCCRLLILLNKENDDERLIMAELNRNLGNFTECLDLIQKSQRRKESIERILTLECERGNRCTVRVDNYFKILEEKAKQEAERKEQERINEEMKDPRWKVCPNGHCYENIRTECIWCGEKRVEGRLDKNVNIQHRELFVGKLKRGFLSTSHYVLTTDPNILMQEERIRKITIDYFQDKFIYFHLDGKNPNPFHFNVIRLNEGCINGRILTKVCEDIIAGSSDNVDLSSYIHNDSINI